MNWRRAAWLLVGATMAAGGITIVQADASLSQQHRIGRLVFQTGNPGKTLSAGYTTMDQETVSCNSFRSNLCTIAMRIMSNVGESTCQSQWAIVALVDGNSVDGAPLLGTLPGRGHTQTQVRQGRFTTAYGKHLITFQIYLPCAANANQWSVRYLVTYP